MATKKKTNTISALYKTIDQKQLSDQAKETLKKLRLATGNFRSKDERANEAFSTFYNKLLEKKPSAVKTTKEYKDMVRQRQVEHMKKIREARKEKEEGKKGQGNDRDAARPAKPYGWRLRGKHNYRKPTLKQIRNGEAYYEGRVNRADVKRRKFPMLEKGGYMEHGGDVDKGGMIYALREYVSSGEIANKTDVLNYDDIAKIRRIAIQYYMDNGDVPYSFGELNRIMAYANDKFKSGYMENGGSMEHEYKVTLQNSDSGDIEIVNVLANSIQQAENKAIEESGLSGYEVIKTDKFSNGGEMESEYKVTLQNTDSGDIEIVSVLANSIQEAEKSAIEESGLNGYEVIKTMKYAKGGMTDHNLMIGDTIKQSFGNILVVENDGKTYLVNINTGQRWTDSEWWSLSKGEITKYTKMAKGGYVDVKENLIKELGRLQRQLNSDRLRVFKEDGSTEEMERQRERASKKARFDDILKTLNEIESNEKMAMGGEIKFNNGKEYKEEFSGSNRWLQVDSKYGMTSEEHENEAFRANNTGDYELRDIHRGIAKSLSITPIMLKDGGYMAMGGEVFYKESHKMGH